MKKMRIRSISVLLIALGVIFGMGLYILRYVEDGGRWAMYFSTANSESTARLVDRNDREIAAFADAQYIFTEDKTARLSLYHVTGDRWGRTGTGVLSGFVDEMAGFSHITGTTKAQHRQLKLSVDTELNKLAYELMDGRSGAVMLCDYTSGELLCYLSTPGIDPMGDASDVTEGAYINRCISAAFTPGSVFKLVTAAAAIENISDLDSREFDCPGWLTIAGVDIICSGVHGSQNFEQALSNSCNCAFAKLAVMLGQDTMIEYTEKYGLLSHHSLDGMTTAAGGYPLDFVGDPELGWSGIGQSTDLVNPYAMLRLVCAIANGGVCVEPSLLIDDEPAVTSPLMDPSTANELKALMEYAAIDHYERETNFPGLDICAKTGTAELGDGNSHSWFVGFLDSEEHPYAFVVLIEKGGSGLANAGALTNTLLQQAVQETK